MLPFCVCLIMLLVGSRSDLSLGTLGVQMNNNPRSTALEYAYMMSSSTMAISSKLKNASSRQTVVHRFTVGDWLSNYSINCFSLNPSCGVWSKRLPTCKLNHTMADLHRSNTASKNKPTTKSRQSLCFKNHVRDKFCILHLRIQSLVNSVS